ncbi:MAG: alpha/beta fold hydrolase [Candidatus Hodarchaeales archaeon]|jgi:pimeloyl-ACP methyl ester carboxylesterase
MMNYEYIDLNDKTRESLPGEFIQLSKGFVHYEINGPVEGDVVVLVHGFSTPLFVWDPVFKNLVKEGFRVLRYDLYGRGYSDRPHTTYNMDLFVLQLLELVEQLGLTQKKINIVGLSMGGGICVVFAEKYPDLVKKVSLIDPIGFSIGKNILLSILKVPLLNKLILRLYLKQKRIIESQKEDFHLYPKVDEYLSKYSEQMRYKGFIHAIRSTALNTPFTNLRETYERLGKRNLPMQLFWGENDQTIPYPTSQKVCAAVPKIEFHTIKECGHMPHYTRPDEVNPLLVKFLRA